MRKLVLAATTVALLGAACARKSESPTISTSESPSPAASASAAALSVAITTPADGAQVDGNVVSLAVTATGMEIKQADGDRTGKTGHFHVFVDKEPVAPGQVIPMEAGIVHSAANPIVLSGLTVGEHTLKVVLGNGAHERVGDAVATVKIDVKGPSVTATGRAKVKPGEPVVLNIASQGVQIKAADGDNSGKTGHYHVFVDPEKPPAADGQVIPKIEGKIIHTTEPTVSIPGLAAGEHTFWVVVSNGQHIPLSPLVASKVTVTVAE